MMKKETDLIKAVPNDARQRNLPVLLRQTKDNSISILLAHLENLFSACDDLFFDLSSRSASNTEQNLYFESMREVRLKKDGVIAAFRSEIEGGFHDLMANVTPKNEPTDVENQNGSLSLVKNDVLEQTVAVTSMVNKARVNCQESLYHLNLRLDYLLPGITVTEKNNPLDPNQICHYFADACKTLDLNIKARIIVFKQFDRLVVSKLTTAYTASNNLLIEAGILPNTRDYAKSKSGGKKQSLPTAADQAVNDILSPQTPQNVEVEFAELGRLFASIRQYSPEVLSRVIPNYTPYAANPGPVLQNQELLQLLNATQHIPTAPLSDEELKLNGIRNIINDILSSHGQEPERALHQPDDDVINLVAMFFDFVLDDKNLPVPIQALISRLQIPVLKIALHDKAFFSDGSHPTRKLINAIAEASIGWDDSSQPEKDRLYDVITKITHEINEQYEDDNNVFTAKYNELQLFIEQTDRKSSVVEKRTEQLAEGQAKTRQAKRMAQKAMFEKLKSTSLPEAISQFLTEHWLNYLVMTHLKHGDESPEWIDATQLIDDLSWASQKQTDAKSLERLEKIRPALLTRIGSSLEKISATREEAADTLAKIEETLGLLHSESTDAPKIRPLTAEQARELGHTPGSGSKSWKDMTGVERQQARYKQLTYDFIRKAEEIPLHAWLSYADNKTGKITRCKLASRIEQTDTYVFVNRFGFKALEKQRKDFAVDLQAGRAAVLDSGQLFDRALSNVLGRLNNPSESPSEK
ncbi:MAG: DUF1631 domain-containing protein [Oceanicoccus sp.]